MGPLPDSRVLPEGTDPANVVAERESIRSALAQRKTTARAKRASRLLSARINHGTG